jgi:hypothetical protein
VREDVNQPFFFLFCIALDCPLLLEPERLASSFFMHWLGDDEWISDEPMTEGGGDSWGDRYT